MLKIKVTKEALDLVGDFRRMTKAGQRALASQVLADTNRFVPMLNGDLRSSGTVSTDNKTVSWNTPYARRQYYNVGAKFSTAGTGAFWDMRAKSVYGSSWAIVARNAMMANRR